MSIIKKAIDYIMEQARENGLAISVDVYKDAREFLKEQLIEAERATFRHVMQRRGTQCTKPGMALTIENQKIEHLTVYQTGAFNLKLFAPGGTIEVGDDGKPLPCETAMHPCNGDYWYKSGCGNRVDIKRSYCADCGQVLRDNKGRWPGQEHR